MFDWIQGFADKIADLVNRTLGPPASFLEQYVWGWGWPEGVPLLAVLLVGTGLYVTVRLAFIQLRGLKHAIDITRGKYDNPEDEGDLNHFQALTTALSATVGIGNIAGVAIAIRMGGPGALFWMWLTAFFGMALKYVECTLAVKYRKVHENGSVSGGPMYYIENGLGKRWKWLALLFASFAAISSFGGGCMNQSNTLAVQVQSQWNIPAAISGLIFTALVGAVIIGGIKRIGRVTAILAPGMAVLYVSGALVVLIIEFDQIVPSMVLIVKQAFNPTALVGGGVASILLTMMWGIRRGLFSNEAGQGSAPIAHATARTKEPVREGLVALLEPFIDTLVICSMTGLVIVATGAYKDKVEMTLPLSGVEAVMTGQAQDSQLVSLRDQRMAGSDQEILVVAGLVTDASLVAMDAIVESPRFVDASGNSWSGRLSISAADGSVAVTGGGESPSVVGRSLLTGAEMTALGFSKAMGGLGQVVVTLSVILFAVSTGISWSYYGDRSVEYVFGAGAIKIYRWVFILFFFLGCILPLDAVWTFGDVALGLMTIPNLFAVLLLSGGVVALTKDYMSREQKPVR